jgi:hypothetical protein
MSELKKYRIRYQIGQYGDGDTITADRYVQIDDLVVFFKGDLEVVAYPVYNLVKIEIVRS